MQTHCSSVIKIGKAIKLFFIYLFLALFEYENNFHNVKSAKMKAKDVKLRNTNFYSLCFLIFQKKYKKHTKFIYFLCYCNFSKYNSH